MSSQTKGRFPYIAWALVIFGAVAIAGVVTIVILAPGTETTVIIAAIFSFVIAMTTALLAGLREVHTQINSRMDELVASTRLAGIAEGRKSERSDQEGRDETLVARDERRDDRRDERDERRST